MTSKYFYKQLLPLDSFYIAANTRLHTDLPDDWIIVLTDIAESTTAIERGRYKDVNTVGAATIMAIVNVDRSTEIPYIFGGDGATLAIPPHMLEGTKVALLASQNMAQNVFGLNLRIALIPVSEIKRESHQVKIAKYRQSPHITQTSISGAGWHWAERQLKSDSEFKNYLLSDIDTKNLQADFSGLECRWKPIAASQDFKFCIIVKSIISDQTLQDAVYLDLLNDFEKVLGTSARYHPLNSKGLKLSLNPIDLYFGIRALHKKGIYSAIGACWLVIKNLIGRYAVKHALTIKGVNWGKYRDEMLENADYRKFDGTLKMVLDVSNSEANKLTEILKIKKKSGQIIYGFSKSKTAIMTCLVFSDHQNHAHFIDGSDGGYALAAKMLKSQASLEQNSELLL